MPICGSPSRGWRRFSGLPLVIDDGTDRYLHAAGTQATIDAAQAASYHLSDALGSVRATADGTGSVTSTADYDAFGTTRVATGTPGLFGYTGEQADPSGLTYLRARYADPETGRFLSAESVNPSGPGTQGYNRYAYAGNNPTTLVDPSGQTATTLTWEEALQLTTISSAVAAAAIVAVYVVMAQQAMLATQQVLNAAIVLGRIAMVLPPGMGIVLLQYFIVLMVAVVVLFHVIATLMDIIADPFGYFLDHVVPGKPPLILTQDQLITASQQYPQGPNQCVKGAVSGVGEELAVAVFLGPAAPLDMMMAAYVGCLTSGA